MLKVGFKYAKENSLSVRAKSRIMLWWGHSY